MGIELQHKKIWTPYTITGRYSAGYSIKRQVITLSLGYSGVVDNKGQREEAVINIPVSNEAEAMAIADWYYENNPDLLLVRPEGKESEA